MRLINRLRKSLFLFLLLSAFFHVNAQDSLNWTKEGTSYYKTEQGEIIQYTLPAKQRKVVVARTQLTPAGQATPLEIDLFNFSENGQKLLLYTNATRVWRINTRGNYYVLDLPSGELKKLGKGKADASLMFAKFSPDGSKVAYVSEYNVYVEDLGSGKITALTTDGTRKFINGTFDWVYEEEFACRDGFRWSPDSKSVLYWQLDARDTRDFYMINNTDSIYSKVIPVEYPKAGQQPSACRLGVVDVNSGKTTWMNVDGNPRENYIVRAEFIPGTTDILLQQLNRHQNESKIIRANSLNGNTATIFQEKDAAWVDVYTPNSVEDPYALNFRHKFNWVSGGKEFLWESEKDGWRHLYRLGTDGKKQLLVTPGNFDVIALKAIDEKSGFIYFMASPANATQKYLYRSRLDGKGKLELLTPSNQQGTHDYSLSPNGRFGMHKFSNANTRPLTENISLPQHKALNAKESIATNLAAASAEKTTEFFKVKTEDDVEMDGWMVKPENFDPAKKYPVVFFVYTEPWGQYVKDEYGSSYNYMYEGDMRTDGYIYISLDNRGTPVPKGREFRKAIHKKIGQVNIRDQAMGAKEILKWNFVDANRVAVWGWSGGGAATLNLMFQYPEIYKTGIAISAVTDLRTYDNIYQERYMGIPDENKEAYIKGSPLTHAKNLKGNLLYIHGTGDDNVHYQNAELLLNEFVKHNKLFQFMSYPNRTHNINEGEGTTPHLKQLYTNYLKQHCPPGGK